ncbi:MAG: oxidoreductase [Robiginitomaculum sp.]|nr:MAG: oxidoreductase [Robiginitomaculum sp.]
MANLAFLGLGTMGYPMAGHLCGTGNQVQVWNRTAKTAQAWSEVHPGKVANSAAEAVKGADVVFTCLGDDPDVRDVVLPILGRMKPGSILVDHTTTSANLARELAIATQTHEIGFIDAPVSGGEAGALNGQLTIMCGGKQADFDTAQPIMQCYAKAIKRMGEAGAGQLTKMVNQICIAGVVQGLAEGLNFAEKAGLDPVEVVAAIGQGAAQSWQMDNRHQSMADGEFEFGFAVDWMRKDLRVTMEEAEANGAPLPLTRLVDQFYQQVQEIGGARWDTSSLIERLRRLDPS